MRNTSLDITSRQRKNIATGYDRFGKPVVSYLKFDIFKSAAGIRSTVNDLLIFASANLGLTKTKLDSAIRLSHTFQDTTGMADIDVAIGWHTFNRHGQKLLWHNGQTGGFKSFIGLDKLNKRAIVMLSNGGNPIDDIALHTLNKSYRLQSFKYPWLIKDTISATVTKSGADAAVQLYHQLKKEQKPENVFSETQLALVGSELVLGRDIKAAIAVYKLNTEEYPKSWRSLNSLGDSYIADGNNALATEAYEKALSINPNNSAALEKLKSLRRL
jgi:tetratricopeptide (TPR) repeat protein